MCDSHKRNLSPWVYKRDKWEDTKPDQTSYFMTLPHISPTYSLCPNNVKVIAHLKQSVIVNTDWVTIDGISNEQNQFSDFWGMGGARTPQHFSITAYHSLLSIESPINSFIWHSICRDSVCKAASNTIVKYSFSMRCNC